MLLVNYTVSQFFLDLVGNEVVTRKELNQRKEWMESFIGQRMGQTLEKTITAEQCPKCDSKEMYFNTMQMRSADEG